MTLCQVRRIITSFPCDKNRRQLRPTPPKATKARIRFKKRITQKKHMFFCLARALNCRRFPENPSFFQEIKKFQLCFFRLFFRHPHYLFSNRSIIFYSIALINFSGTLSNVFFYLVALINFFKNRFNVFFKCLFLRPPLIRYFIFSDPKQINLT